MADDDKVGYCRPPRQHQFKPGQSGNPRGRPKGRYSASETIRKMLGKAVTVTRGGKKQRIGIIEAALERLNQRAIANGELQAIKLVLELAMTHLAEPESVGLSQDDQAILQAWFERQSRTLKTEG